MGRARSRSAAAAAAALLALGSAACGSTRILHATSPSTVTVAAPTPTAAGAAATGDATAAQLGVPYLATKNTTRVAGADPIADAAAVALAVYPSVVAGTHPTAVTLAPTDSWQAAIAASSLMAAPFRAPVLLSGSASLPAATTDALQQLAPTGDPSAENAQVIRVGDVPQVRGLKTTSIGGASPYAIAANLADYEASRRHGESTDVVIASADDPADAMVAAGWLAESGEPLLYVNAGGVPTATATQLRQHHDPHIYVLGGAAAVPAKVLVELGRFGTVKRISAGSPAAESVAFAEYRDPACPADEPCVHIPHSFGWAIRGPGHGYVLLSQNQPLAAAAASALSSSGGYGPQLLVASANTLPEAVLNYFTTTATPGYNSEGPTAAVYNHAWLIGTASAISSAVQAQVDSILEVQPVQTP